MRLSEKKILIVEDNPGDQILLREFLQSGSIPIKELIYASYLEEAISLIDQSPPDVILLDLTLPDSSGLDTYLSVQGKNHTIPVIILSGLADEQLALNAIQEGAQDYLVKDDFDERLLSKTIEYSIERKKNLEELRVSNDRYNAVAKVTNDMVWDWDLVNNQVFRNAEQFSRLLKFPPEASNSNGDFWHSRVHPEDIVTLKELLDRIINDPMVGTFDVEYRFLRGDQTYIILHDRGHIIRDNEGNALRFIGSTQDVTDRKKKEEELRLLSIIAKETVNAVIVTDTEGYIEWTNEAFTTITGYSKDEAIGKKPGTLLQGKDTDPQVINMMRDSINQRTKFQCEVINYSKVKTPYWIKIQCQPIFDETGNLVNFFAIETDITQQKMAEAELKKSEEKYRFLFESNPANMIIWDIENLSILEVNETAQRTYGYSREEFLEKSILEIRPVEDLSTFRAFARDVMENEHFRTTKEWRHLNKNGEILYMQITSRRINYNNRPAVVALGINVTDKVILEKKLEDERILKHREINQAAITAQENEREEIGKELHDNINQLLASGRLYLNLVRPEAKDTAVYLQESDKLIMTAIEEIRKLSHALIPPSLEVDEFMDAVENIIQMASTSTGMKIVKKFSDINTAEMPGKLQITVYRIIQEQFSNIIKYSKANTVWISIAQNKNKLLLNIKDNGVGCDLSKKTNGVGLTNIRTRASLFNGEVKIVSAAGQGFELEVCFDCDKKH